MTRYSISISQVRSQWKINLFHVKQKQSRKVELNSDSAAEGEARVRHKLFRCEGNGSVPLSSLQASL